MRVHHNSASSLRRTFASFWEQRVQRREIAELFANPDLSPSARQEVAAILIHAQNAQSDAPAIPAQRVAGSGALVLVGATTSR
ncbi:hypothetical protein [Frankia sp. R82]|uniref:hypothetical protein n=1 Tax=Frankia sp. R82 TaxID=2950553 RepID=UPI002044790B|nr:hypothetical protein [Frankia sp. R82]MCM3882253.1 hypothetical protein [Frankia sp. R82]